MGDDPWFKTGIRQLSGEGSAEWGGETDWSDDVAERDSVVVASDGVSPASVPTEGVVSYWPLDESSGDAIDDAGDHDGTVYNATQGDTVNGRTAYSFDGTDAYVDVGDHAAYKFGETEAFTVSTWFRISSSASEQFYMVDTWNWESGGWFFRASPDGGAHFRMDDSNANVAQMYGPASADTWHQGTVTVDRDGEMRIYTDGELGEAVDVSGLGDITSNQAPLTFAYQSQNGYYTPGALSSARIYDRVLSSDEVQELYGATR